MYPNWSRHSRAQFNYKEALYLFVYQIDTIHYEAYERITSIIRVCLLETRREFTIEKWISIYLALIDTNGRTNCSLICKYE